MKCSSAGPLLLLLVVYQQQATAWNSRSFNKRCTLKMDTEGPMAPFSIPFFLRKTPTSSWNKAEMGHDMPWKSSIAPSSDCVFMPFWEWQSDYFQEHLTNFEIVSMPIESVANAKNRMVTICATSDEYRFIRMTYLDGGAQTQIFTSVCYPRGNHPILGFDFLQFGGKRHLAVVDFHPIHEAESQHDLLYEQYLQPIRQKFPSLQEEMTDRFFDPTRYFSNQTLLGRFDSKEAIWQDLWPAYQAYMKVHVKMTQQTSSNRPSLLPEQIVGKHAEFDTYLAERDPAHPMFASMFGPDFAEDFLYQVLFPLATRPNEANIE